ncbi:MAG: carbonate dehydratase [Porticoccus sp.]|nr:carbonate dehydratase [Porticoccus sp.]
MSVKELFINNIAWAQKVKKDDPAFFQRLSLQHAPEYLWIGCSDSRVPANEIIGLMPGELFVHRNVANLVVHDDLNCLSVIQYAITDLKVKHVIVCGHYGCGGITASVKNQKLGTLVDNWLLNVDNVQNLHRASIEKNNTQERIIDQLCELNVIEQVANVSKTSIVSDAWSQGQKVTIHGWIYSMTNGLLSDLDINVSSAEDLKIQYTQAIDRINDRFKLSPENE